MLFNSWIFLAVFMPVTLAGFYTLSRVRMRAGTLWLLAASLVFYGYYNPWYLLLIAGSVCFNYAVSGVLRGRKLLLLFAVCANVGLIFYFKYYDFFISNINSAFHTDFVLRHVMLPLGISFFTFQQISFVVDAYRGKTASYGFLEYAVFVTFFPQLVAGPIVMHNELIPQLQDASKRVFSADDLAAGLMRFTVGLSKKVLIADFFAPAVAYAYAGEVRMSGATYWLAMLAYALQLYFDFSGYSDMAVGLSRMFRLKLPENFRMPYASATINELWTRWHMTLTRFLRTYIYFPLGGSRRGEARTLVNMMIVFLISGLWHGANHTYVLWGAINGAACCVTRVLMRGREAALTGVRRLLGIACTYAFWVITIGLFRADTITQWRMMMQRMFTPALFAGGVDQEFASLLRLPGLRRALSAVQVPYTDGTVFAVSMALVFAAGVALTLLPKPASDWRYPRTALTAVISAAVLFACLVSLARVSVFLYFNF